ncbi:hypothetical protein [Fodinibius sp.]|uniref:hypothetical protein n=1 Tax=Fodinibius sp. TaxID=1872440 RepID=UPI002ACDE031|nr:hypothetical protein [Fodinibius sp.]MDZ7658009.1 hypothetical protein [Fodinibius sp.]
MDEAIEEKSQIPLWIDEHVPEVPGKDAAVADQTWNSWFELKMRRTNIQKNGSWGAERKEVRTMPVFCSNFKPKTDHLLSRCIILEYSKEKRGLEKHVLALKNDKELLQLLMLSFMQHYNLIDRKAFRWDMDRVRSMLKEDVKQELKQRSGNAILQDRQISQFAALITVRHWLHKEYRNQITGIAHQSQSLEEEENQTYRRTTQKEIADKLADILDADLYQFVKSQIVKSAVTAAQHDPLSNYLETIGTLIQANKITEQHFNWTDDGHLKIWAKAVWDKYLEAKRGTDDLVRRETVEAKLRKMSELSKDGSLKTVNWTPETTMKSTSQKGFYIKNAAKKEIFRHAFHINEYGPALSQLADDEQAPQTSDTNGQSADSRQTDIDDDLPF